ncbi:MAG: hypothetical protein AB1410_07075 [Acidobacteriota bacterium]
MKTKIKFFLILIVLSLSLAFIFSNPEFLKKIPIIRGLTQYIETMKPEELKNSIMIFDIDTMWIEKYTRPWETVLVPVISFRVKNIGDEPLRFVYFNGVFKFKDEEQSLGDAYLLTMRKPLYPNQVSDRITLKSNYGYKASSKAAFINNPRWKEMEVKIFTQSKSSGFVYLGTWNISKKIEGISPLKENKIEIAKPKD